MNSFTLQCIVVDNPQLRYTSDNQTPVAEFLAEFPSKDDAPPHHLRCLVWGDKSADAANLQLGTAVILEGRLRMNRIERPEGFKETRAEFTISKWHVLSGSAPASTNVPTQQKPAATNKKTAAKQPVAAAPSADDFDDIPF